MSVTSPAALRHPGGVIIEPRRSSAARRPATARRDRRQSVTRTLAGLAMLLPYAVFAGVALAFALSSARAIASLWWVAPATFGLCVLLTGLAVGEQMHQRRRRRLTGERTESMQCELRNALEAPPGSIAAVLSVAATRPGAIRTVRDASRGLSGEQQRRLRAKLDAAGVTEAVEGRVHFARRKWQRIEAVSLLGWLGRRRSIELLAATLRNDDRDLAYCAGQSLGEYADFDAYRVLLAALATELLPRSRVATLLEDSPCPQATALLVDQAASHDPKVRFWIAYLLGRTHDPGTAETLRALAADEDLNVRANATEALGDVGDTTAIRALLRDPEWLVRAHAAKAARAAKASELAPELANLLSDRHWWVRQNAMLALQQLDSAAVGPVRLVLESEDRFARNKATEILAHVGYVSEQLALLGGAPNEAAAWRFALALGRAEGTAELQAAAAGASDPTLRHQIEHLLERAARSGFTSSDLRTG